MGRTNVPTLTRIPWAILATTIAVSSTAAATTFHGIPESEGSFRLFLGSHDGDENNRALSRDVRRYVLGAGMSEPIGEGGHLGANLEVWASQRAYRLALNPAGSPVPVTFTSAALVYGLRMHANLGAARPYAWAGAGFQGSELRTRGDATSGEITERVVNPTAHVGVGIEWQVGRDLFSLDYRRGFAEAEFSDFETGRVRVGSEFLGIGLGTRW